MEKLQQNKLFEACGGQYFGNANLHVGASLSKMVKAGILERHKRGAYRLLQKPIGKPQIVSPTQIPIEWD